MPIVFASELQSLEYAVWHEVVVVYYGICLIFECDHILFYIFPCFSSLYPLLPYVLLILFFK